MAQDISPGSLHSVWNRIENPHLCELSKLIPVLKAKYSISDISVLKAKGSVN